MLRVWGVDLLDLFRERNDVSPRRVLALLSTLGESSAFMAAKRGVPADWNVDRYLRKAQTERLDQLLYVVGRAAGGKPSKPQPIPAPDDELGRKRAGKRKGQSMFAGMAARAMSSRGSGR